MTEERTLVDKKIVLPGNTTAEEVPNDQDVTKAPTARPTVAERTRAELLAEGDNPDDAEWITPAE